MIEGTLSTIDLRLPAARDAGAARTDSSLDRKAMYRKAVEFEAIYLAEMLKPMFEDLQAATPFDGGFGEDVWRSMQLQEFGKAIAGNGGVGLADAVYADLLAAQEARSRGSR
jgi:Rod binding domain-containing protein